MGPRNSRVSCIATSSYDISYYNIRKEQLPVIKSSSEIFGKIKAAKGGLKFQDVPIAGVLGDQHAALLGQNCFRSGEAKNTYGTGCFMLYNTGNEIVESKNGLLTTMGYQLGPDAKPIYALEGSIAVAGSGMTWLQTNMGILDDAKHIDQLAGQVEDTGGVFFVPAFSGLFAPFWRTDARG